VSIFPSLLTTEEEWD